MKCISIVVPVYNEAENIKQFFSELTACLLQHTEYEYEIIFVDDGSHDATPDILMEFANAHPQIVRTIIFSRNFGKEMALTAGMQYSKGSACVLIDSDLQHPVGLIPSFVAAWQKGAKLVIGVRDSHAHVTWMRRVSSSLFYAFLGRISKTPIIPHATDFRLLDRTVVDQFCRLRERTRLTRGLIDWLGFSPTIIYFTPKKRKQGDVGYRSMSRIRLGISSIVSLSLFPLRIAGFVGGAIMTVSTFLGIFIFVNKYLLGDPYNFQFSSISLLAVLILFVGGLILVCLGLIAMYIASIYEEVVRRPLFVIKEMKGISTDNKKI